MEENTMDNVVYDVLQNGCEEESWSCPADGVVDYYALVLSSADNDACIYHEDNCGFKDYDYYPTDEAARAQWDILTAALDAEYSEWDDNANGDYAAE